MKALEHISHLVEAGWEVRFFKNDLGSITATARLGPKGIPGNRRVITDDFTMEAAAKRIFEKVYGAGEYA